MKIKGVVDDFKIKKKLKKEEKEKKKKKKKRGGVTEIIKKKNYRDKIDNKYQKAKIKNLE